MITDSPYHPRVIRHCASHTDQFIEIVPILKGLSSLNYKHPFSRAMSQSITSQLKEHIKRIYTDFAHWEIPGIKAELQSSFPNNNSPVIKHPPTWSTHDPQAAVMDFCRQPEGFGLNGSYGAFEVMTAPCFRRCCKHRPHSCSAWTSFLKTWDNHTICWLCLLQVINQSLYRHLVSAKDIVPTTSRNTHRPTSILVCDEF